VVVVMRMLFAGFLFAGTVAWLVVVGTLQHNRSAYIVVVVVVIAVVNGAHCHMVFLKVLV